MTAERAADGATAVTHVQDLIEASGAHAVQAVQNLGPAAVCVVALIADFTLQLIAGGAVEAGICICTGVGGVLLRSIPSTAHCGLMLWETGTGCTQMSFTKNMTQLE